MPHIISDYSSIDIFYAELSKYYLSSTANVPIKEIADQNQFKAFQLQERHLLDKKLEGILLFERLSKRCDFFTFPPSYVIKDMDAAGYAYSTYQELPEHGIQLLQQYCAELRVSLTDGLCATLGLALSNCCNYKQNRSKKIFMGIIKSTRDHSIYDDKIGCFLRLDGLKMDVRGKPTLASLCKQIHQSTIDTMPHQMCSGMVKLAAMGTLSWKSSKWVKYIIKKCIHLYTKIFPSLKLNPTLLAFYIRLISFWKNDDFYIYVNLLTSFLPSEFKNETSMFGLEARQIKLHKYDLSRIDHVLEICFLRDESNNKPYLVVSANVKPAVRELIAEEMVRILQQETVLIKEKIKKSAMIA